MLHFALISVAAELFYHSAHVGEAEHRTPLLELLLALTLGEDGDVVAAYVLVRLEREGQCLVVSVCDGAVNMRVAHDVAYRSLNLCSRNLAGSA